MEPEELYKKLEELREIKKEGNPGNLNYYAVINSMPCFISFGDLVRLYDYMQDVSKENNRKAGIVY